MNRISIYDAPALERFRKQHRLDPHSLRQLRGALCKRFARDVAVWECLPVNMRADFASNVDLHPLELYRRNDSQIDGATKLLFRTRAGMLIESVILRIATGRTTLCVSSQVGCAAACDFCATGKMGVAQNLSAEEILDQVVQAGQIAAEEGRRIRNLVFMGMGEPFHNEQQLHRALLLLTAPDYFHHSPGRILVSTVGVPEAMIRCARRFPSVNQALSLHSANRKVRERLIPLARRHSLEELQSTVRQLNAIQPPGTDVMIEYLMLAGLNDSADDAAALVRWLHGLRVHVNLIPFNPIDDAPHLVGSEALAREAFAGTLKQTGLSTTIRYSLGADIDAACGQLVRRENRALAAQQAVMSKR